jgi:hypothetical protein
MGLARLFKRTVKAEIAFISGVLRVTIEHGVNVPRLVLDSVIFVWVGSAFVQAWSKVPQFARAIFVIAAAGTMADLAYQLTGSEILEFGPRGLKIQRSYFGWERAREYAIDTCSEFSWQPEEGRDGEFALECKAGWRRIQFGKYLDEVQAMEVLSELQRSLPDVAQKMGMSLGDRKSHITRLGLN